MDFKVYSARNVDESACILNNFYWTKPDLEWVELKKGVATQFRVQLRSIIQYLCLFVFIDGARVLKLHYFNWNIIWHAQSNLAFREFMTILKEEWRHVLIRVKHKHFSIENKTEKIFFLLNSSAFCDVEATKKSRTKNQRQKLLKMQSKSLQKFQWSRCSLILLLSTRLHAQLADFISMFNFPNFSSCCVDDKDSI